HLIVLDLVECLSPAQIQQAMQLPSNGAFRKLKHEAFTALREVIRRELGGGAESTYLFLGGGASVRKPGRAPAAVSPLGATRQQPLKTRRRLASRRRVPRPAGRSDRDDQKAKVSATLAN
ncbi:MAG TPA: hypothetical protein VMW75_28700, partial [Thermoanaerobaculia bacterium]|nr:hypothetical protein [Thermoanaerobaculia bacterium]